MQTTTVRFQAVKGRANYNCSCQSCGKKLHRTVVVENTINPWNKNDDGSTRTYREVFAHAQEAAEQEAAEKEGSLVVCTDCEDQPNRTLLLEMAADPKRVFPPPERYFDSPMHVLADRGQVESVHERCTCGSECCSGFKRSPGYRITSNGLKRAANLRKKAEEASG